MFHKHINFGAGNRWAELDLRGQSKMRPMIESIDYDMASGEVVVNTTARCGLTGSKAGRIRIPGSNVAMVVEQIVEAPAKAPEAKKAA